MGSWLNEHTDCCKLQSPLGATCHAHKLQVRLGICSSHAVVWSTISVSHMFLSVTQGFEDDAHSLLQSCRKKALHSGPSNHTAERVPQLNTEPQKPNDPEHWNPKLKILNVKPNTRSLNTDSPKNPKPKYLNNTAEVFRRRRNPLGLQGFIVFKQLLGFDRFQRIYEVPFVKG